MASALWVQESANQQVSDNKDNHRSDLLPKLLLVPPHHPDHSPGHNQARPGSGTWVREAAREDQVATMAQLRRPVALLRS